ncbi:MAG TPA: endonuclease/exonuclease/phosphatase family protein [Myxococcaceae bacterium]|jgi:endonuclease/exonuclease/phosphatase family metal-dependent hydrolase
MRKSLFSLLGAGLTLLLIFLACGGESPPVPPKPDGGSWVACEGTDAGVCAPGESCVYVERYERSLCVRPCGDGCEDSTQCCSGSEDGGTGGYCMPRDVCEPPDAGTNVDGGTEPNPTQDGGSDDAGTNPNPGTDAGTSADAGTNPETDAGTWVDAGTNPGLDAGTSWDAGFPMDAGTDAGTPPPTFARIRIMASNLTSGNNQSYDPGHGTRLMQGAKPDIVLIQEFDYGTSTPTVIRDYVTSTFGASFQYFRESEGSDNIPNGVISRWPIIAAGEWADTYVPDRDYVWARIDIPGPKDLWAVSVHLWSGGGATGRNNEANQLVGLIRANIPAGDYLVIGGDFNTNSFSEAALTTLSQVVSTAAPHPVDQNGNPNTNASRARPYDQVLADADLRQYQGATVIGASTYPNGLVLDSRVYTPLSEVAPVLVGDSAATNMQHMGVIKDFFVPAN